ncbi:MAG: beta-glucuronidase, partial [Verrucomicrobiae bacterium]|nr:beta-glucuronidase [Verrucomicrobiae bacterium]
MKKTLLSLIALAVSASAQHIPNLYLHPSQPLDGDWNTIVDPYESGFYDYRWNQRDQSEHPNPAEAFYVDAVARNKQDRVEYNFDTSPVLKVPGDWNTQRAELFYYEGSVWYRHKFDCPEAGKGGRFFLRFGAVNYRADVYLNGKRLGTHWGGFTPFDFEVTGKLRENGNSLVVRADNKRHAEDVPTLNTDWWNYGGITRDVTLVHTPDLYIASHSIALESEETRVVVARIRLSDKKSGEKVAVQIPDLGVSEVAETNA